MKQSLSKSTDDNPHTMALILYEIKKISLLAVIWIKFVMLSTVLTALWVIDEPTTPTVLTADFIFSRFLIYPVNVSILTQKKIVKLSLK